MGRDAWWSEGQEGYYYSNRIRIANCYMAQTHTHIVTIEDLDRNADGLKEVQWATKRNNVHQEAGIDRMRYTDIARWLLAKNRGIGAVGAV